MQKSYSPEMTPALLGQIADLSNKTVDSFAAEGALNPGDLVARGTVPGKQVKLVTADTLADAIGVVIHEHKMPGDADGYYQDGYAVGVMTKGRVWVPVDGTVTAGQDAGYDVDKKAFTATAAEMGVHCRFITDNVGDMAEIEISGPAAKAGASA